MSNKISKEREKENKRAKDWAERHNKKAATTLGARNDKFKDRSSEGHCWVQEEGRVSVMSTWMGMSLQSNDGNGPKTFCNGERGETDCFALQLLRRKNIEGFDNIVHSQIVPCKRVQLIIQEETKANEEREKAVKAAQRNLVDEPGFCRFVFAGNVRNTRCWGKIDRVRDILDGDCDLVLLKERGNLYGNKVSSVEEHRCAVVKRYIREKKLE